MLISLGIIFCLLMMVIYAGVFVTTGYQILYLIGYVMFALSAFGLFYLDEKRSGSRNPNKTLTKKLLFGFIGGLMFAGTVAFVYTHLGRLWAIGYFSSAASTMYGIHKYLKAKGIPPGLARLLKGSIRFRLPDTRTPSACLRTRA